jgi:ubiquinone biosynthesis protein COQ9
LHVNKFGWNQKAIQAGCNDLDMSSASHGILQNGAYDLIDYIMQEWNNNAFIALRKNENLKNMKKDEILKLAI